MIAKLSMVCTRQSNGSYFAICPEVNGCFTQGDSYEDAVDNIKELVEITVKKELSEEEINEISLSKTKIFSEFEVIF